MENIINLADRLSRLHGLHDRNDDQQIVPREGLDLLAAYCSIANKDMRLSILQLVRTTAREAATTRR